ncbi:MAG: response regulator transcription factor, partial [Lachnospiraceae bacterium]|nr:response regulator transcription factor [Lachnospiraceae bacterium]
GNGREGLQEAESGEYDLLLLDVMLPEMSGFEICRQVRQKQNLPIILITARTEDVDKVRGLGLGADDYIVKPFNPTEMVARVRAHIRIHERLLQDSGPSREEETEIVCGELVISKPYRRVMVRGREVNLKNREYELLLFLASNPGIVFKKDILFERIWGLDANGDTATVMVHIGRIREKIERDPQKPEYILTVWGAGYKFTENAPV